jgi:hypothetical protein
MIARRGAGAPAFVGCAIALASVAAGCADTSLPGTLLGTYRVTASLQSNACGTSLAPPNPWDFDVQLSEQGSTLYWSWMDGTAPLSNTLTQLSTSLNTSQTANVDGTADGGLGPCTMQRADSVNLTLATGSPPGSFQATIQYAFSVASGANCGDQLSASGGSYDVLPCSMSYTGTGARQ